MEILAAAAGGDRRALGCVAATVLPAMNRAARTFLRGRSEDAEDAVQDAWCAFLGDPSTLSRVDPAGLGRWFGHRAQHGAMNLRRRRQKREATLVFMPEEPGATVADTSVTDGMGAVTVTEAVRILQCMPEPERAVLILADVLDCSHAEVAQALGDPVGTVQGRLGRARRRVAAVVSRIERFGWKSCLVRLNQPCKRPPSRPLKGEPRDADVTASLDPAAPHGFARP